MLTIFADSRIEVGRYRRMETNGFNVAAQEKFLLTLIEVYKQLDPTVVCVAGACQRDSQIILARDLSLQ